MIRHPNTREILHLRDIVHSRRRPLTPQSNLKTTSHVIIPMTSASRASSQHPVGHLLLRKTPHRRIARGTSRPSKITVIWIVVRQKVPQILNILLRNQRPPRNTVIRRAIPRVHCTPPKLVMLKISNLNNNTSQTRTSRMRFQSKTQVIQTTRAPRPSRIRIMLYHRVVRPRRRMPRTPVAFRRDRTKAARAANIPQHNPVLHLLQGQHPLTMANHHGTRAAAVRPDPAAVVIAVIAIRPNQTNRISQITLKSLPSKSSCRPK